MRQLMDTASVRQRHAEIVNLPNGSLANRVMPDAVNGNSNAQPLQLPQLTPANTNVHGSKTDIFQSHTFGETYSLTTNRLGRHTSLH